MFLSQKFFAINQIVLTRTFSHQPLLAARFFSTTFNYSSQLKLENEIRIALAKLHRMSEVIPPEDEQRKQKAVIDLEDLAG